MNETVSTKLGFEVNLKHIWVAQDNIQIRKFISKPSTFANF